MDDVPSDKFNDKDKLWPHVYKDYNEACARYQDAYNNLNKDGDRIDDYSVSDKHYNPNNMNNAGLNTDEQISPLPKDGPTFSQNEYHKANEYVRFYNNVNMNHNSVGYLHQLTQLLRIVSDGDLISKAHRDALHKEGLIVRCEGWQVISEKGIRYLHDLGIIKP